MHLPGIRVMIVSHTSTTDEVVSGQTELNWSFNMPQKRRRRLLNSAHSIRYPSISVMPFMIDQLKSVSAAVLTQVINPLPSENLLKHTIR